MKYLMTGRLRVVNGMLRTIENGELRTAINFSMELRRQKMIKWIKTTLKKLWDFLNKNA